MKKVMLSIIFCGILFFVIPGESLFADISIGGRIDAGGNLFAFIFPEPITDDDGIDLPGLVLPLLDMGFSTQLVVGPFHFGAGLRGLSIIYINLFWPSLYAELEISRFTLSAGFGGGAALLYMFPIFPIFFSGPFIVPELSLWLTFNKANRLKVGVGAMAVFSSLSEIGGITEEDFRNFRNNVLFFIGVKGVINYPWIAWKRV